MTYYPDVVVKIDRFYIEHDLYNIESPLLNKDGKLDDSIYDAIAHELFEGADDFIKNCYARAERGIARFQRNIDATSHNPHYRFYAKYGKNGKFEMEGVFTNLSDARDAIRDFRKITDSDDYKITEVKDGIEGTKNFYQPTLF